MVGFEVEDVKTFMNHFLIKETFDMFCLFELELGTFVKIDITGKLNKKWFSSDESQIIGDREYVTWKEIKPQIFGLIKGNKTPTVMKAVLMLSRANIEKIILSTNLDYSLDEVSSLVLNIRFEDGKLLVITGTSLNTFRIDKDLENQWDEIAREIFRKKGIV